MCVELTKGALSLAFLSFYSVCRAVSRFGWPWAPSTRGNSNRTNSRTRARALIRRRSLNPRSAANERPSLASDARIDSARTAQKKRTHRPLLTRETITTVYRNHVTREYTVIWTKWWISSFVRKNIQIFIFFLYQKSIFTLFESFHIV